MTSLCPPQKEVFPTPTLLTSYQNGIHHHEDEKLNGFASSYNNSSPPLSSYQSNGVARHESKLTNGLPNHHDVKTNGIASTPKKCATSNTNGHAPTLEPPHQNDLSLYNIKKIEGGDEDEQHLIYMDYIITASIFPSVLHVALELDLLGIIARAGPGVQLSSAEVAAQLPAKNPEATALMLDRILRLLASHALLTCSLVQEKSEVDGTTSSKRCYGLAPPAKYLLPDEDGVCLAPLLSMAGHKAFRISRSKLKDAIIEGGSPFNMAHGMSAFEYAAVDPSFNNIFNKAMNSYSTVIIRNIVEKYKGFKGVKELVEVAGGYGHTIRAIVAKHPSIKCINFDLPHVIREAPAIPGVEHVSGDMFVSVPKGDAILMKWIIHDWNDEMCIKLLKNCYASLPIGGRVIIIEGMLTDIPETSITSKAVSQIDIAMMTQMQDGKERTKEEFIALSNAAGFVDIKFNSCICNYWIIELYK